MARATLTPKKAAEQIKIKLSKKQLLAYKYLEDDVTTELLYGGGARGGKSWMGCLWQILRRVYMPGSAGLIAREELTKLKDTTLLTFFKVAKKYGYYYEPNHPLNQFEFNHGSLTAQFHNGSIIFFREIKWQPADPEYDRLGSYDLTDAFIDEAQQIRKKAIDVLKGRFSVLTGDTGRKHVKDVWGYQVPYRDPVIIHKKGSPVMWYTIPKCLYTCNPRRNWIYSDFVFPDKESTLAEWRKFIKALPKDNPHVTQEYIDNLMKADPITVQRLVYGNFEYDDDPAKLVDFDAIMDIFTNDHILPTGERKASADLAMQGRDRMVGIFWDGMVATIALDQAKSTGKSIENDIKQLMITQHIPHSKTIVDSDGLGNYLDSYLEGIKTFHGNGVAVDDAEFANIKAECGWKLAEMVNRRMIKIVCSPEQKQKIIEELGVLKSKTVDGDETRKRLISKEQMKEDLQRSPDYLDALLMGMYFILKPGNYQMTSE